MRYLLNIPDDKYNHLNHIRESTGITVRQQILNAIDSYYFSGNAGSLCMSGGAVVSGMVLVFMPERMNGK